MDLTRGSAPAIWAIGGEALTGSGFETEDPAAEFESDERFAEKGDLQ